MPTLSCQRPSQSAKRDGGIKVAGPEGEKLWFTTRLRRWQLLNSARGFDISTSCGLRYISSFFADHMHLSLLTRSFYGRKQLPYLSFSGCEMRLNAYLTPLKHWKTFGEWFKLEAARVRHEE